MIVRIEGVPVHDLRTSMGSAPCGCSRLDLEMGCDHDCCDPHEEVTDEEIAREDARAAGFHAIYPAAAALFVASGSIEAVEAKYGQRDDWLWIRGMLVGNEYFTDYEFQMGHEDDMNPTPPGVMDEEGRVL